MQRSIALWGEGSWRTTTYLGRRIEQLPQDLQALQEIITEQRPQIIIETGLNYGGSALYCAALLSLLGGKRAISVEISVRPDTRAALAAHALGRLITIIEGDATDPATIAKVEEIVGQEDNVMVVLDSDHRRDHVRAELDAYSRFVPLGGWLVVFDGVMEWIASSSATYRLGESTAWLGDNPLPAIHDFVTGHPNFAITDKNSRLGATFAADGFLQRRW